MRKSRFEESYVVRALLRGRGLQTGFLTRTLRERFSESILPALSLIFLTHDVILEVGSYLVRI